MRVRARSEIFVIVVKGQHLALRVGQFEHGIQRRIEPPRIDFRHDRLVRLAGELEDVRVAPRGQCAR